MYFRQLNPDSKFPTRATPGSAGFDLYATETVTIEGGKGTYLVGTGIAVELPEKYYGRIAMRSGLAKNQHLAVSAGVIDRDYEGEVGVLVYCTKMGHTYTIKKGDRFAQIVIEKYYDGSSHEIKYGDSRQLPAGHKPIHIGFGSTGITDICVVNNYDAGRSAPSER